MIEEIMNKLLSWCKLFVNMGMYISAIKWGVYFSGLLIVTLIYQQTNIWYQLFQGLLSWFSFAYHLYKISPLAGISFGVIYFLLMFSLELFKNMLKDLYTEGMILMNQYIDEQDQTVEILEELEKTTIQ